ncbi:MULTISPECIES: hypothetical protein [Acinetobacter]|uniref:hypothetical protein n=1 Tax=Acinetobacter TaxID=469 RepID=UPI00257D950A|nr:hypothetical protein [Acinetobacter sp. UBA5984]
MIKVSKKAGLLALQAHATFLDSGSGSAYFVYYSDTKPASVETSANPANALCTLTLPEPCFKQLLVDGIELHETATALATQAGTAVWARLYNGNDEAYADFTIGTSDADIILNSINIAVGSTQKLDSIILKPF